MTTMTLADEAVSVHDPSPAPAPHRFATWYRARAVRHLTGVVIADSGLGDERVRFVLPANRPAVARVKIRAIGAHVSVEVTSAHLTLDPGLASAVAESVRLAAEHVGLTGSVTVNLSVPTANDSGADLISAACVASVTAVLEATETPTTGVWRTLASRDPHLASLTAPEEGRGSHRVSDGILTHACELPRLGMLLIHRPGSSSVGVTNTGTLPDPDAFTGDPAHDAGVLVAANGPAASPVLGALTDVLRRFRADGPAPGLGFVGGHTDSDPLAYLLLPGRESLLVAAQLQPLMAAAVAGDGWKVTYTTTAP